MKNLKNKSHLLYFFQITIIVLILGGLLSCNSHSSDEEEEEEEEPSLSSDGDTSCFKCVQSMATGDDCGSQLISGSETTFQFDEEGGTTTLNMGDQINLSGTHSSDGALYLTNDSVAYIGPGCDMYFTNVTLTATIESTTDYNVGWVGTLSYHLSLSAEEDCDSYSFNSCDAVHTVTCTSGC